MWLSKELQEIQTNNSYIIYNVHEEVVIVPIIAYTLSTTKLEIRAK
jgi:hypothetical protein